MGGLSSMGGASGVFGSGAAGAAGTGMMSKIGQGFSSSMSPEALGQMGGEFLGKQLMSGGGEIPQAPGIGGGGSMMQQMAAGRQGGTSRINWATPMTPQDSIIQALLARGLQ
jgi:hypothetical protein